MDEIMSPEEELATLRAAEEARLTYNRERHRRWREANREHVRAAKKKANDRYRAEVRETQARLAQLEAEKAAWEADR